MNINIEAAPHTTAAGAHTVETPASHPNPLAENTSRGRIIAFFVGTIVVVAALVIATLFFTGTIGNNNTDNTQIAGPLTDGDDETNGDSDGTTNGNPNEPGQETPEGREVLPTDMNGQQAIDALGDDIDRVAELNGKTTQELKELLLRDNTVHISKFGYILYKDTMRPRNTQ